MHPIAAATDPHTADVLDLGKVLHQFIGGVGNENLARSGLRLQPLCDIDGITDHGVFEMALAPDIAGNYLAGVDSDADRQAEIGHAGYVDAAKLTLHFHSGGDGAQRGIPLDDGRTEGDHDAVTLKLGEHAFVFEGRVNHGGKVPVQNINSFDRIDFGAYGAEAPDIREKDGGYAPLTLQTHRFGGGQQPFNDQR